MGVLREKTPFLSDYPSHHVCPCLLTLCQLGQAGMSIPDLSLRSEPSPPLTSNQSLGSLCLTGGGLGSRDPSQIPKGGLIWGQYTGLSLDKAVLCAVLPATTVASAFLCLPQIVSAPDFHF